MGRNEVADALHQVRRREARQQATKKPSRAASVRSLLRRFKFPPLLAVKVQRSAA